MPTFIFGFVAGAYWMQTQAALPSHAGAMLAVEPGAACPRLPEM
ncbi:hypothetical protein [Janthinobacterium sp.]|nr:hypothetical protein [Janthinobacterium sp.]